MSQQIYLTAPQIETAVRKIYVKNGYLCLSQVRNGTGFERRTTRTADMVAVSTWPSRGLFIEGIEIKSSKSDLQRELERPDKAEEIASYCRHWWLACAVGLDEGVMLPPNWGVISVNDKLVAKISKPAAVLTPKPMDALLVCSMLRSFAESYVPLSEVEPRIKAACEVERKNWEAGQSNRLSNLELAVKAFHESSGIDLMNNRWEAGNIGMAVKLISSLRGRPVDEIASAKASLRAGLESIEAALSVLDAPVSSE